MNVEGAKSLLDLARKMPKLEAVIHVSTAYAHCYQSKIEEQLYASDKDLEADEIIEMCSRMPSEEMNSSSRTKSIIGLHPNTYTFTKAVAEGMLGKASKDLPIAIVRPSIVVASWKDPFPGKYFCCTPYAPHKGPRTMVNHFNFRLGRQLQWSHWYGCWCRYRSAKDNAGQERKCCGHYTC